MGKNRNYSRFEKLTKKEAQKWSDGYNEIYFIDNFNIHLEDIGDGITMPTT